MSTDTPAGPTDEPSRAELAARVAELEEELSELGEDVAAAQTEDKMVIVATQGTLDMAYPPLILASTAAAFGYDVTVFHTFWGLSTRTTRANSRCRRSATPTSRCPTPSRRCPGWTP